MCDVGDWRKMLEASEEKGYGGTLALHSSRGRPLGSDSFISKLEAKVGKRLRPLPVGRPRKEKENK